MLGYYATREKINGKGEGMYFADIAEIERAMAAKELDIQSRISVRLKQTEPNTPTAWSRKASATTKWSTSGAAPATRLPK
jgi:DNA-directed RNA polymerase subunit beta'